MATRFGALATETPLPVRRRSTPQGVSVGVLSQGHRRVLGGSAQSRRGVLGGSGDLVKLILGASVSGGLRR